MYLYSDESENSSKNDSLENESRLLVERLSSKYGRKSMSSAFANILGYTETPSTIDEFVEEDSYLGSSLRNEYTGDCIIYPIWRKALQQIYPNSFYSPYTEVILGGAIGLGKTTVAKVGALYDLYKLLLLENPHGQYRLTKSTNIVYALINATLSLAGNVLYDELIQWVVTSHRFSQFLDDSTRKQVLFKNGITIDIGSRASSMIGRAIFGAILSELNFQNKVADQAKNNYNEIKRRIDSRFNITGGSPGHLWLDSSKTSTGSWLEAHIKNSKGNEKIKVYEYPVWEVQKYKRTYSGKKFLMYCGDDSRDPFIVDSTYKSISHMGLHEELLMKIPLEYYQDFKDDPYSALRDIAGRSIASAFKFIPSQERIEKSMVFPNIVNKDVIRLDFHNKHQRIIDYFPDDFFSFIRHPNRHRTIGLDLATIKDRIGIASSYVHSSIKSKAKDTLTGEEYERKEPLVITEFCFGIESNGGDEMPLYKIEEFIFDLVRRGYPVGSVVVDGFQSSQMRQKFEISGINSLLVSVDKTYDPYSTLKRCIYENRWMGPKNQLLRVELSELEDTGKKVDHPDEFLDQSFYERGSKDLADALTSSVYNVCQEFLTSPYMNADTLHSAESEARQSSGFTTVGKELEFITEIEDSEQGNLEWKYYGE